MMLLGVYVYSHNLWPVLISVSSLARGRRGKGKSSYLMAAFLTALTASYDRYFTVFFTACEGDRKSNMAARCGCSIMRAHSPRKRRFLYVIVTLFLYMFIAVSP